MFKHDADHQYWGYTVLKLVQTYNLGLIATFLKQSHGRKKIVVKSIK
jgi:hypothetical protein